MRTLGPASFTRLLGRCRDRAILPRRAKTQNVLVSRVELERTIDIPLSSGFLAQIEVRLSKVGTELCHDPTVGLGRQRDRRELDQRVSVLACVEIQHAQFPVRVHEPQIDHETVRRGRLSLSQDRYESFVRRTALRAEGIDPEECACVLVQEERVI